MSAFFWTRAVKQTIKRRCILWVSLPCATKCGMCRPDCHYHLLLISIDRGQCIFIPMGWRLLLAVRVKYFLHLRSDDGHAISSELNKIWAQWKSKKNEPNWPSFGFVQMAAIACFFGYWCPVIHVFNWTAPCGSLPEETTIYFFYPCWRLSVINFAIDKDIALHPFTICWIKGATDFLLRLRLPMKKES